MKDTKRPVPEEEKNSGAITKTNGDKHNLMPDETSWAEEAKEDLEDFIESQGIHIRQ